MNGVLLALKNPVSHATDQPWLGWYVSSASVMLILAGILTAAAIIPAAKRIATRDTGSLADYRTDGAWANFVEWICLYLRENAFRAVLGKETDRFAPLLWTLFWFILFCNLLGLVPLRDITAAFGVNDGHGLGGTATQSIWVNGGLAVVAFLYWNGVGLYRDWKGWFKHMTADTPFYIAPLMVVIEFVSMFVKPFALAVRLFANMTAGHVLIAALLSFVLALPKALGAAGWPLALVPLLGAAAINLLEIVIALVQAFIFTFLTCVFLGQLVAHHEEEGHGEHEAEAEARQAAGA